MEVNDRIEAATKLVEEARGVPLSASCVVHRGDLLELLDSIRVSFPADLSRAEDILRHQNDILENARLNADQMIEKARDEVAALVAETEIVAAARKEAQRIMDEVHEEAQNQQGRIDEYIDSRLATLEVILNKTLDVVARGRDRLDGVDTKSALKELGDDK
jgi:vacuolar-type H+-ATPase subunit H